MARLVFRAVLAALVATLVFANLALAENDNPQEAVSVSAANATVTGTLVGSRGGAFRFYRFAYPGGDQPVTIHLTWNPGWQSTDSAFNFNVYGPNGLVGRGSRGDDAAPASTSNLIVAAPLPGDYLVQVYSYTDGTFQAYTLDFGGLASPPEVAVANTSPETAVAIEQKAANWTGTIRGSSAGAFAYFDLDYPGSAWPLKVSVAFSPAYAVSAEGYGFNVYDGDALVVSGSEVARTNETATKEATIDRGSPGRLRVQVYNYADGVGGSYVVAVTNGVGPVASATGNATPDTALLLTPALQAARGTLLGNGGGAFAYFGFNYNGDGQALTLGLAFTPSRGITAEGVAFNVYRGTQLVATGGLADDIAAGRGGAYVTYTPDTPGYYVIQVYNYVPDIEADYTLYCMGLD